MRDLHILDLIAIGGYFLFLFLVGVYTMRTKEKGKETESFLAADRNMNTFQITCSTTATDMGGGFSIAMGGLGFTLGLSGSWIIAVSGLSIVLVSFFMVPKVKHWADKMKGLTTGDLFEARFDQRTGTVAAIVVGLAWSAFVGGQIIAGGKLLQVSMGWDLTSATLIIGAIIVGYTAMGGLKAVIYTDVFQMVILMIGIIFILVPVGLMQVGGIGGMVDTLSSNPETASLLDWTAAGWKQIIGWFFAVIPIWFVSIVGLQRIVAARDVKTAQRAFFYTGVPIEWPLFAVGTTLVGLIARILMPDLADPELATPTMIMTLLPVGIGGLVIAAYIATVMSTADSCLIGPVAIFTNDIYKKYLKPDADSGDMLRVARITTIVLGVLTIGSAFLVPRVLDLILYAYTFAAAGLFFPMLGLLFWKRTTASGAFWSIVSGGACAVIWTVLDEPYGFAASYVGWVVSLPVLIIISLNTKHSHEEDLETFYK
ncbi:sodium:solute symporter family protein [Pseudemcibacter aquimaris]|uniref:sodium:solute symporter family protein n=1 Tax=Pseudemcibacter aquimaris TaxID=2857064 RepID=UPI0020114591|nr:sodium:solute symporter family protein [Pseudemcibacter aquimaris]MCC3862494.1 sodium:solute symporter family protein [Pseudemcibacter aquimaris]WDU57756.1 sodium:solute symporter family protein [Pseudemcibacter aquimaris]